MKVLVSFTALSISPSRHINAPVFTIVRAMILAVLMILPSAITSAATAASSDLPQVKVSEVQDWPQGEEYSMYCVVNTPFVYQASSHSEAELLMVMPVGSQVVKGQLIARQDDYYLQQNMTRLSLEQQQAEAEFAYAKSEHHRLQVLDKKKLVANARLNQASLELNSARLKSSRLSNQKATLEHRIDRLEHRAPFDAQVLAVSVEPGEQLGQGQKIFQLLPVNQKQIECKLPLIKAKELQLQLENQIGQERHSPDHKFQLPNLGEQGLWAGENVELASNEKDKKRQGHDLRLRQISQSVDVDTQNLQLYFDYPPESVIPLLVGQRVQVIIQRQYQDLSRVPYDAVTLVDSSYQIWQLNQDNTVSKINPSILSTTKDYFVVRSPLRAGDMVVVRGQKNLKERQAVRRSGASS